MAMAMVKGDKPLAPVKNIYGMATPDFETFQLLMRKADQLEGFENAGISCVDTTEIDNIYTARISSGNYVQFPQESDIHTLQSMSVRSVTYPKSHLHEFRRIQSGNPRKRLLKDPTPCIRPLGYDLWECDIVWDDIPITSRSCQTYNDIRSQVSHSLDGVSDSIIGRKLRRTLHGSNVAISEGGWVDSIIWDEDRVCTFNPKSLSDGSNNYDDMNVPLIDTSKPTEVYIPCEEAVGVSPSPRIPVEDENTLSTSASEPMEVVSSEATTSPQPRESAGTSLKGKTKRSNPRPIATGPLARLQKAKERHERLERYKAAALGDKSVLEAIQSENSNQSSLVDRTQTPGIPSGALTRRRKMNAAADLEHSIIAAKHRNTRACLKNLELVYFHRPHLTKMAKHTVWNIMLEKKGKHKLSQRKGNIRQHLVSQISKASDLALTDGDFVCIEYIEENPNMLLNIGMASKILNYYRSPVVDSAPVQTGFAQNMEADGPHIAMDGTSAGGAKGTRPRSNSHSSGHGKGGVGGVHSTLSSGRLPRHVQRFTMAGQRQSGVSSIDIPKLPEGVTEVLEADEKFPFLGDIEPGAPPQPALHTNLFRAPLFVQSSKPTDFLLVRVPHKRTSIHFIIRQLQGVFTCGQQEPLMIVPKPVKKKTMSQMQQNFVLIHLTRHFLMQGDIEVETKDLMKEFSYFFTRYKNDMKKCIQKVADLTDEETWKLKPSKEIISPEEYEALVSPEDVCLHERGLCSEHKLQSLGISQIMEVSRVEQALGKMHQLREFRSKCLKSARERAKLYRNSDRSLQLDILVIIFEEDLKKLDKSIEVARFIHERMLLTPWVITESFVKGYLEKGGMGVLRLVGLGDPSGIGEGFSLLRPPKTGGSRRTDAEIYNTESDLRKKTKRELDELLMRAGYDRATLKTIPRWDKVDLFRQHANIAYEANVAHELHRFARASKPTQTMQVWEYQEKCIQIWKAQAKSLTIDWETANSFDDAIDEDEEDADDDFDISDVEEAVAAQTAPLGSRSRTVRQSGDSKEDEDTKELKSLKTGEFFDALTAPETGVKETGFVLEGRDNDLDTVKWNPPSKVVKRVTRRLKADGTEEIEVRFIVSDVEVERVKREKNQRIQQSKSAGHSNSSVSGRRASKGARDEEIFEEEIGDEYGLKFNFSRMKNKVEKHVMEEEKRRNLEDLEEQREFEKYLRPERSRRDRLANRKNECQRNSRLPHVLLASSLEKIITRLSNRKISSEFYFPVDTRIYTTYLNVVKQPICLRDIRDKNARYEYPNVESLLADIKLMADNAAAFNGDSSTLARNANDLYNSAIKLYESDRKMFDIQESDTRAKFNALERPLYKSMVSIPDVTALPSTASIPAPPSTTTLASENFSSSSKTHDHGPAQAPAPTESQNHTLYEQFEDASSGEEEVLEEGGGI